MQANQPDVKTPDPCPSCVAIPKEGAILCVNCGHIYNVVQAFKNGRIAYGAVEMERLSAEEWVEVNAIQAERKAQKEKAKALAKAKPDSVTN